MKMLETIIEKHMKIMNWVGVIVGCWILSMIASELISAFLPATSFSTSNAASINAIEDFSDSRSTDVAFYMPICERNIFDSQKRSPCVKTTATKTTIKEEPQDPNAAPVKSSINAKLKGTTVFGDASRSFATIAATGKTDTENLKIDDKILNKARIYKIERNRVYFFNRGRREYLEIDGPSIYTDTPKKRGSRPRQVSGGLKRDGNNITVSRAKVDSTLSNMNKVLQDARMVPNYTGGAVDGFKVFGIKSGSIFQELGLKNGDVINQINGTVVDGIEKALPMLQLLKTQSDFDIGITRRGAKQDLKIKVE